MENLTLQEKNFKVIYLDKMWQVEEGECKYETEFRTEKGKIILWIEQGGYKSGSTCLQYNDKINSGIVKQKAIDDL